jgi:hypothetical protein
MMSKSIIGKRKEKVKSVDGIKRGLVWVRIGAGGDLL